MIFVAEQLIDFLCSKIQSSNFGLLYSFQRINKLKLPERQVAPISTWYAISVEYTQYTRNVAGGCTDIRHSTDVGWTTDDDWFAREPSITIGTVRPPEVPRSRACDQTVITDGYQY